MTRKLVNVVAAVLVDKNKKILVAKRKQEKSQGGKWEFPGGKVDDGESHQSALERELFEEFAIITKTGEYIGSNIHSYNTTTINLMAYFSEYKSREFKCVEHDEIAWVPQEDLFNIDFTEADIPLIKMIKSKI